VRRIAACGLLVLVAAGSARADGLAASAPIPPVLEIEVLDPNVNPVGNPTPIPVTRADGTVGIEIPPAVLVHRMYYTGNRTFQGPYIPGGPSVLVFNHPKTGERCYVPAQMPPGFPRVTYTGNCIRYDYGPQSVVLLFGPLGKPYVEYKHSSVFGEAARERATNVAAGARNLVERSNLPTAKEKAVTFTKGVAATTVDRASQLTRGTSTFMIQVFRRIPGASYLVSSPEERAERLRDAQIRYAEARDARTAITDIPTLR
jgi:hypothetical protein